LRELDVITIGRASVDLYGQQIGGRLEDMASFAKSVGGSPTNIAIGAARLGLRTGLITRVGREQFGSFILEQLAREGVATRGVTVDPERLTALAILGVKSDHEFPLLFYRDNCADMALCEADVDPAYVASSGALQISGTHLTRDGVRAASLKAVAAARAAGRKVAFDIDYRPNLWGLGGHDSGAERYRESEAVTAVLQTVIADCDLIVGTEEEIHIAGGSRDSHEALCNLRAGSSAVAAARSRGSSFWVRKKTPLTFVSITLSHPSSGNSSMGAPQVAPALFTRMSRRDSRPASASARAVTPSRLETSAGRATQSPPYSFARALAVASQAAALRELIPARPAYLDIGTAA